MNTKPIPPNVAALDHMLVAIGRWQAHPSAHTWHEKLAAIRTYVTAAERWDLLAASSSDEPPMDMRIIGHRITV
jgi:hypothetical protein